MAFRNSINQILALILFLAPMGYSQETLTPENDPDYKKFKAFVSYEKTKPKSRNIEIGAACILPSFSSITNYLNNKKNTAVSNGGALRTDKGFSMFDRGGLHFGYRQYIGNNSTIGFSLEEIIQIKQNSLFINP